MLARDNKKVSLLTFFRPCIFMNTLSILVGIWALSMRVAPIILYLISAPIFSFFLAPGALKGANTVI